MTDDKYRDPVLDLPAGPLWKHLLWWPALLAPIPVALLLGMGS